MNNNQKYRCLVLDDQAYATDIISLYIKRESDLTLVAALTDPFEAVNYVNEGVIDLVFLDIEMPGLDGIQFLRLCGERCRFILTTAYSEYALQGFDFNVVDYLLKPISFERFSRAVNKFRQLQLTACCTLETKTYITIKGDAKHKYYRIRLLDIIFVKGLNNYIAIHTHSETIVTYMTLKGILKELPSQEFCMTHRSYIIGKSHIKTIDDNHLIVGDHLIPLSKRYKKEVIESLKI